MAWTDKRVAELFRDATERPSRFTRWENEFIAAFRVGKEITPAIAETLTRIEEKAYAL